MTASTLSLQQIFEVYQEYPHQMRLVWSTYIEEQIKQERPELRSLIFANTYARTGKYF